MLSYNSAIDIAATIQQAGSGMCSQEYMRLIVTYFITYVLQSSFTNETKCSLKLR